MTITPPSQISPTDLISKGFDKALATQASLAKSNVDRLRRINPDKSPQELIKSLGFTYLSVVTLTGCGAGAAGAVPGLAIGLTAALADLASFTEASVLYVLSVAEVHGLHPEDIERRRALVLAVMVGGSAAGAVQVASARTGPHLARKIVKAIPMTVINRMNNVLGRHFITKYGSKQGVLVLGKQLPLGLGAAIGGAGNHLLGRSIVAAAHRILGDPEVGE